MFRYPGELLALGTALCWTLSSLSFEYSGKRVGSLPVNLIRLLFAFIFLGAYSFFARGFLFPTDASLHNWIWLSLSGLVGFILGDMFLFKAFTLIGARIGMLIMSLTPPITAVLSFFILGQRMNLSGITGMVITLAGISLVILSRGNVKKSGETHVSMPISDGIPASGELSITGDKISDPGIKRNLDHGDQNGGSLISPSLPGIFCAVGGAFGQSLGLILAKVGMTGYDPFAATYIRVIAGIIGYSLIFTGIRRWDRIAQAFLNPPVLRVIAFGAFIGPFLGVSLSLAAVSFTSMGIASTIMHITPVMVIPFSILLFKDRVSLREVAGAVIAVLGVAWFFVVPY